MINKPLQVVLSQSEENATLWDVLNLIREQSGISRSEISQRLGLSKACVSSVVKVLLRANVVRERIATSHVKLGRKPIQLFFDAHSFHTISIDLGGTYLRGGIVDGDGRCIFRTVTNVKPKVVLKQLKEMVHLLISKAKSKKHNVLGVGIGVAGTVDPYCGKIFSAPALGLREVNLSDIVSAYSELPTFVDNDVNLAAVGEQWRGAGHGCMNMVCVSVGTGIGAGLIINGHVYRGSHSLAGEVGYFYLHDDLPTEPYSEFGALEIVASGAALERLLKVSDAGEVRDEVPLRLSNCDRVNDGDVPVDELDRAFVKIGVVVANLVSLLDPDVVVLTGGVVNSAPERALDIVTKAVNLISIPESRDKVRICIGELGDYAVLVGAAYMVQEALLPQFIRERGGE